MTFDPFGLVDELAAALDTDQWMLVGGLMVHAHAQLAGLASNRPTTDADVVVNVELQTGGLQYGAAATALQGLGFRPHDPPNPKTPSYRFLRGSSEVIDLMATDRSRQITFNQRPVLQVPASSSAAKHTEPATTPTGTIFRVPTLPGALALKGAACTTSTSPRVRHNQDAILLFACVDVRGMDDLSKSQRSHVNHLFPGFARLEAWQSLGPELRLRALRAIRTVRPDWSPPSFLVTERHSRGR